MNGRPIHPLEEFTRKTFDERFAAIILRGLGVKDGKDVEDLSLACERINEVGAVVQATFSVIAPLSDRAGKYHPLILAAMLKLLLSRTELTCNLQFTFKEVLRELIWPDTDACRRAIDDALEYHLACLYLREDICIKGENINSLHLISVYDRGKSSRPQGDRFTDDENQITFDKDFIEALREGEIKLGGISFGKLSGGGDGQFPVTTLEGVATGQKQARVKYAAGADPRTSLLSHPETKPTVRIKTTPVSQRNADHGAKILARPIGQIEISINTGTIASTILRALHLTAARYPISIASTHETHEAIAEKVYQEVDRQVNRAIYSLVKEVRRDIFEDALRDSYGLMHSKFPKRPIGERGPKSPWHSSAQFVDALSRAIEAIEYNEWKPRQNRVTVNRRWALENVRTATIKMVAAYWTEVEGMPLGQVDSGQMKKWLNSLRLSSFSILRAEIRGRIDMARSNQAIFKACGGNLWGVILFTHLLLPSE
jgi:hypothetical protein